jgi:two-component system, OmpR family, phosphate regulon sensor histidine kinase PhoR
MASVSSGAIAGSDTWARGFRRIVLFLVFLVIVPTALLLIVGITMLVFWQEELNLVFGILVVGLVGCLVAGAVVSLVFLRKEAKLSKLQLDFVSKVSHELRTPLTSIRMFVEMLQMKRLQSPEEIDVCLDVLAKESGRLTERIQRLLDWGRMESGRKVYDKRMEEPRVCVEEAADAFRAAHLGREVPLDLRIDPDLPKILADRSALVDAIVNLLTNAYKYTGEDKRIALSATADAKYVKFVVADNGIGIPLAEHRRIFEKFYRVDDRLSREVEGSGLGLAIVRHITNAHGGRILVESEPGKGSTFTLLLPRPNPSEVARAEREAAMVPAE